MSFRPPFVVGSTVTHSEICAAFQCGNMGGMRRSKRTNTLIIISDHTKALYDDKWQSSTTGTSNWRCGSPEPTGLLSADGLSNGEPVLRLWNLLRNPIAPTLQCACQWKQIYPMERKRLLQSKRRQSNCCNFFFEQNSSSYENFPSPFSVLCMPSSMLRTNMAVVTGVMDGCCVITLTLQWQAARRTLTGGGTWYSIYNSKAR